MNHTGQYFIIHPNTANSTWCQEWTRISESESHSVVFDSLRPHIVHGILQARILQGVAFPFSRGSSQPRDQIQVSCIAGGFFTTQPSGKPWIKLGVFHNNVRSMGEKLELFWEKYKMTENRDNLKSAVNTPKW